MDYAMLWARLRELYFEFQKWVPDKVVLDRVCWLMHEYWPVYVPDPKEGGDQGTVDFADGSTIQWDWDNGDFYVGTYDRRLLALTYPCDLDDPIYWDKNRGYYDGATWRPEVPER